MVVILLPQFPFSVSYARGSGFDAFMFYAPSAEKASAAGLPLWVDQAACGQSMLSVLLLLAPEQPVQQAAGGLSRRSFQPFLRLFLQQ